MRRRDTQASYDSAQRLKSNSHVHAALTRLGDYSSIFTGLSLCVRAFPERLFKPTMHGWSPKGIAALLSAMRDGDAGSVHGDFVLTGQTHGGSTVLFSSPLSALPYYWTEGSSGQLVHGRTVFEVVKAAKLPWAWDHRAIQQIAAFDHPLGSRTLHPRVRRIAPGSWVRMIDGRAQETAWMDHERWWGPPSTNISLDEMVAVLQTVFAEFPKSDPWVSLSAGFDSRVLLGLLRAEGHSPTCATMGTPDSTDRRVATQLAKGLDLRFHAIELQASDYLHYGRDATAATSGAKSSRHYHTYIYAQKMGLKASSEHFVGSNGEFARTFFLDAGPLARLAEHSPLFPWRLLARARIRSRTRGSNILTRLEGSPRSLEDDFCAHVPPNGPPLHRLDLLYAQQRVRHFIGHGISMYAKASRVFSPFLDVRWMRAALALRRADKLGGNAPRAALANLDRGLLHFPLETRPGPIAPRAPWWYALARARPGIDYAPHRNLPCLPEVASRIIENTQLDVVVPRHVRERAVKDKDTPFIHLLLTLGWAAELAADGGSSDRD